MQSEELMTMIANGEDSRHQFKATIKHAEALAAEMTTFSNSNGGYLLIGINDDGSITGLNADDIRQINQLIANAATNNIRPAINPFTQNFVLPEGRVTVVYGRARLQ